MEQAAAQETCEFAKLSDITVFSGNQGPLAPRFPEINIRYHGPFPFRPRSALWRKRKLRLAAVLTEHPFNALKVRGMATEMLPSYYKDGIRIHVRWKKSRSGDQTSETGPNIGMLLGVYRFL